MKTGFRTVLAAVTAAGLLAGLAGAWAGEPAFFGMQVQGMPPEAAEALDRAKEPGIMVRDVALDSPAGRAGVLRGDVIIEFADERVETFDKLLGVARGIEAGDDIDITVLRGGEIRELEMETTAWPAAWKVDKGEVAVIPDRGITLAALTANVRKNFGLRWSSVGVVVSAMEVGSTGYRPQTRRGHRAGESEGHLAACPDPGRPQEGRASPGTGICCCSSRAPRAPATASAIRCCRSTKDLSRLKGASQAGEAGESGSKSQPSSGLG